MLSTACQVRIPCGRGASAENAVCEASCLHWDEQHWWWQSACCLPPWACLGTIARHICRSKWDFSPQTSKQTHTNLFLEYTCSRFALIVSVWNFSWFYCKFSSTIFKLLLLVSTIRKVVFANYRFGGSDGAMLYFMELATLWICESVINLNKCVLRRASLLLGVCIKTSTF